MSHPTAAGLKMVSLWLILAVGLSSQLSIEDKSLEKMAKSVCRNLRVDLNSIDRLSQLAKISVDVGPCRYYRTALEEIRPILKSVQSGRICNLDFVEQIRKYHKKFINTAKDAENIPEPLAKFFMSLCFQVNAECKMSFLVNLEADTKGVITQEDYAFFDSILEQMPGLFDGDTELDDFDDIILFDDLLDKDETEGTKETKLVVKAQTNEIVRRLISKCQLKFKPFYEKLILPIIELSNLGYKYHGELIRRELDELKNNELALRWYKITQLCEIFGSLEIYEDKDDANAGEGKKVVKIIDSDEANKLRAQNQRSLESQIEANSDQVHYEPQASQNRDDIWINDQSEMKTLIKKFKSDASERDNIRARFMKRIWRRVREIMMSRQVLFFVKDVALSQFESDEEPEDSMSTNVIQTFDRMIERDSEPANAPVAGWSPRGAKASARVASTLSYPSRVRQAQAPKDMTKVSYKFWKKVDKQTIGVGTIAWYCAGIIGVLLTTLSIPLLTG